MSRGVVCAWVVFAVGAGWAGEIKHRFLAKGESRPMLHYVDQFDPQNDWDLALEKGCRDLHLIAGNRLLMSHPDGYLEFDLNTRKQLKKVAVAPGQKIESLARLANGHTLLAGRKGCITVYELDAQDQLIRTVAFEHYHELRLFRLSPEGHFLFGANTNRVVEADWDGRVYADFCVPGSKHVYWIKKLDGGRAYRVVTGYGHSIVEITPAGKILRSFGQDEHLHFFSRPFELENSHIVVCNWTGHKQHDPAKGPQLLEFDSAGNVVWQWEDSNRAGSIHGVIILE